jgi:hypothetical protein
MKALLGKGNKPTGRWQSSCMINTGAMGGNGHADLASVHLDSCSLLRGACTYMYGAAARTRVHVRRFSNLLSNCRARADYPGSRMAPYARLTV